MKKKSQKRPSTQSSGLTAKTHTNRAAVPVGVAIACLTFLAFSRIIFNGFVDYDDDIYITQNAQVQGGLTFQGLYHACTDMSTGNWYPLTLLSHMFDCTLYGLNPAGHHVTGLLLHSANAFLLYLVLYRMTGSVWRSAAVALLFGIHPLHVVSVAHAAQRKDVLSTFFWLLTMLAYARYGVTRSRQAYFASLGLFALGLLSKPMLVSLPVILLALDYWPLGRFAATGKASSESLIRRAIRLAREKIPFFVLALALSVVTFVAQKQSGFVASFETRPLLLRIENATVSYVMYLVKTVWPTRLAAFYPYPESIAIWKVAGAAIVLTALSAFAVLSWKRRPYVVVGWLWYILALIPVIGIIQVGAQSMADRYSYVPLIGIFIAIAWGLADVVHSFPRLRVAAFAVSTITIAALAATSWVQAGTWRSPRTLWQHAVDVTKDNHLAYCNLGMGFVQEGKLDEAEKCFQTALRILPKFSEAKINLANVYTVYALRSRNNGQFDVALAFFAKAVALEPVDAEIYMALGRTHFDLKNYPEAVKAYAEAVRLSPARGDARGELGIALEATGDYAGAERELREALRLQPGLAPAQAALERLRNTSPSTSPDTTGPPKSGA